MSTLHSRLHVHLAHAVVPPEARRRQRAREKLALLFVGVVVIFAAALAGVYLAAR